MPLGIQDDATNKAQLALKETAMNCCIWSTNGRIHGYTHVLGVKLAPLIGRRARYGVEVMRRIRKRWIPMGNESWKMAL